MDLISPACLHHGERRRAADTATDTDTDTDTAAEMHKRSAVKSPLGTQTVLGDRHDLVCEILLQVTSAACGTRPAEFFNGWVRKRILDGLSHGIRATETDSEMLKRSAVKRSRRAQTVLGDRHDLVCEILLQVPSAACGTRPAEFFNGWVHTSSCVPRRSHKPFHRCLTTWANQSAAHHCNKKN